MYVRLYPHKVLVLRAYYTLYLSLKLLEKSNMIRCILYLFVHLLQYRIGTYVLVCISSALVMHYYGIFKSDMYNEENVFACMHTLLQGADAAYAVNRRLLILATGLLYCKNTLTLRVNCIFSSRMNALNENQYQLSKLTA